MDSTIFNLTALTTPGTGDLLAIVDVSDHTDSANGTTKKIAITNLISLWKKETPTGVFDGANLTYTLSFAPITSSLSLFVNGQFYVEGVDYSIGGLGGNIITLVTALPAGYTGTFVVQYQYITT